MSAPTTNVEKQKSRHAGVLRGIGVVCGFVAIIFVVYYAMATSEEPEEAPTPAATVETAPATEGAPAASESGN